MVVSDHFWTLPDILGGNELPYGGRDKMGEMFLTKLPFPEWNLVYFYWNFEGCSLGLIYN